MNCEHDYIYIVILHFLNPNYKPLIMYTSYNNYFRVFCIKYIFDICIIILKYEI